MRSPGPGRWWILVVFIAVGVALTAFGPTRELLIGPAWLALCALVALFYARLIWRAKRLDRLRRSGVAARATARSVRELKLSVHEMPMVEAELDVNAPDGAYETTQRLIVPLGDLERLRAGEEFPVKVDPGNRARIAFEWPAGSGERSSWVARAHNGPATIDPAALAEEAKHIAPSGPGREAEEPRPGS
jgi:hypothetical protein